MLDFLRKKPKEDKPTIAELQTENKAAEAAASVQPSVTPFSNPGAMEILSKAYEFILSVELYNGIYQIEARSANSAIPEMAQRGYYDVLYKQIAGRLSAADENRFAALFLRKNLYAHFCGDKTSVNGEFALKMPAETKENATQDTASPPPEQKFKWYNIQAVRLAPSGSRLVHCFFLIRAIQNSADNGRLASVLQNTQFQDETQRERIRTEKLLDGNRVMFFEYQMDEDTLILHREPGNPEGDRIIKGYLSRMTERCDWTIFHADVISVKEMFQKGEGTLDFRYRVQGAYDAPFEWHRMRCAKLEENGKVEQIIGAISNINEEYLLREDTHRLSSQLSTLISTAFTYVAEIDLQKGTTVRINTGEEGYTREGNTYNLKDFIRSDIQSKVIHPDSAAEYEKWLKPGYLNKVTADNRIYETETRLKLPNKSGYGWYTENIACPDQTTPHYFIRMRRNVTEQHEQRERYAEMKQQMRFAEYNQTVIDALSSLIEFRDAESGEHVQRVRSISNLLLESLRETGNYPELTPEYIQQVCSAAAMHDVGKIAISDSIMNKPGKLAEDEFAIMKTHTLKGAEIIDRLDLTGSDELRACCRDIALHHHERYDGKGYPENLAGDDISIAAQVVGLADAYDALVSKRPYKEKFTHEDALHMIQNNECGVFNPKLMETLLKCADRCRQFYIEETQPKNENSETKEP